MLSKFLTSFKNGVFSEVTKEIFFVSKVSASIDCSHINNHVQQWLPSSANTCRLRNEISLCRLHCLTSPIFSRLIIIINGVQDFQMNLKFKVELQLSRQMMFESTENSWRDHVRRLSNIAFKWIDIGESAKLLMCRVQILKSQLVKWHHVCHFLGLIGQYCFLASKLQKSTCNALLRS